MGEGGRDGGRDGERDGGEVGEEGEGWREWGGGREGQ